MQENLETLLDEAWQSAKGQATKYDRLVALAKQVIRSASDEGCTGETVVVDSDAVNALEDFLASDGE